MKKINYKEAVKSLIKFDSDIELEGHLTESIKIENYAAADVMRQEIADRVKIDLPVGVSLSVLQ